MSGRPAGAEENHSEEAAENLERCREEHQPYWSGRHPSLHISMVIMRIPCCPAKELFCAGTDQTSPTMDCWICRLFSGCGNIGVKLITDIALSKGPRNR